MSRRLVVAGALVAALSGASSAFAVTVATPGAGTKCAGVNDGSTTIQNGSVSHSGGSAYFNGVAACK